mmetsp:Transcript_4899/g.7449  ORF Transcript_4899/g.7449 Transcript_4899/m.7449 type:complete len:400 (-) Transcript_4899:68-1267(-)
MKIFDTMLLVLTYRSFTKVNAFTHQTPALRVHHRYFSISTSSNIRTTALFAAEKARILFLGTPDVAATSLTRLVSESKKESSTYEIIGVVTQPPKRRKRKGKEIPSPVGITAEELDIPVLTPEKISRNEEFLTELEEIYKPDLCITAAYGQYLPKRFLKIPKFGTLNIHPSLLPRWRGASPVQRSLEAGDNPVGVSVLFTVSKMDAGPIVKQVECEIDENDDATKLLPDLFDIGNDLLVDALQDVIDGKITMDNALVQDEEKIVNADMIDSSEGELFVWRDSARSCHNKVRGFSMWPGTFIYVQVGDDQDVEPVKMKIIKSRVLQLQEDEDGGELTDEIVLGPNKKDGLRVVCGDGSILELLEVQPVTRKAMDAKSFVNGLRGEVIRWVKMPEPVLVEE